MQDSSDSSKSGSKKKIGGSAEVGYSVFKVISQFASSVFSSFKIINFLFFSKGTRFWIF